jgi:hypothetical protein
MRKTSSITATISKSSSATSRTSRSTSSTSTRPSTPARTTTSSSPRRTARNPAPRFTPSRTPGSGTSRPSAPTSRSSSRAAASPTPCAPSEIHLRRDWRADGLRRSRRQLAAEDKYQFQWWALGQVGARPAEQKKGADRGIDGRLYFHDDDSGQSKQIIFSVKAGGVTVPRSATCVGVLTREKAEIGVFICFEEPTKPMLREAAEAGSIQINRRHHLSPPANPHHPADSRRQAARVSAAPPRCDLQKSSAQPPRSRRELDPPAFASRVISTGNHSCRHAETIKMRPINSKKRFKTA